MRGRDSFVFDFSSPLPVILLAYDPNPFLPLWRSPCPLGIFTSSKNVNDREAEEALRLLDLIANLSISMLLILGVGCWRSRAFFIVDPSYLI